ncbi:MAG: hypothetical protein ABSH41_28605, partial [Syntrophobacteraceae bacterium]
MQASILRGEKDSSAAFNAIDEARASRVIKLTGVRQIECGGRDCGLSVIDCSRPLESKPRTQEM